MKTFFGVLLAALLVFSGATYYLILHVAADPSFWTKTYYEQARIPMFTGFLTLGSFLLTLQTVIIQRLKDGYDSADYARKVKQIREKGKKVKHYGSLQRVGIALATNVILALTTSLLQLTIGFIKQAWATSVCIAFGLTTILLVIYLTIELVVAHNHWFEKIEAEKS